MTDGLILPPGGGHRLEAAGMTLKVGAERSQVFSAFESEVASTADVRDVHGNLSPASG
ncbi:hypothetical protein ACQP2T_60270 [Nonomuraea sp. CA-143628]|uniref:hypothetical protein n=1 Tax=Nonomuraea sp. CA-143628 TaxID=3239997 RepID=UPI003D91794D